MSFIYALPFEKPLYFSWMWTNLLILFFLGVICTAVCWVLRAICIKNVSAVTCAVLMPMSAVVATVTSIIFRMESFSWNVVIGGLIITAAIVLSGIWDAYSEKKQKAKESEAKEDEQNTCEQ
jgi:drug/metabolite transporter (DMT)-like permease